MGKNTIKCKVLVDVYVLFIFYRWHFLQFISYTDNPCLVFPYPRNLISTSFCFRLFWIRSSLTALFWSFWTHKLEKQWVLNQNPCYHYQDIADYNYYHVVFFHRASKLCLGNHCHPSRRQAAVLPLSWCPCTITSSLSSTLLVTTSGQDCYRADCFFRQTSAHWRALSRHMEIENSEMFSFFSLFWKFIWGKLHHILGH